MGMSPDETEWLSLTEAGALLGVHPSTLRRWCDAGDVPHFRTPGGHRRFRAADLAAWMRGQQATALVPHAEALVQTAVRYTQQEMVEQDVTREPWHAAFAQVEERQQMRDTGRRLFGLAIQYMGRTHNHEPILHEGRRIGEFYGRESAQRGVGLVDTMRAFFFFRESLLRAARPGQANPGQYDAEDVRIHRQLRNFLDEVMFACLASYEAACRHLLATAGAS
jgi:excisionase family DNA binding protein